jgi:hypothetical protein
VANPIDIKMPERCLLIQALLWVSRGQLPVDDAVFLAAPDALEKSDLERAKPLIRYLRDGSIQASGKLTLHYQAIRDYTGEASEPRIIKDCAPPAFVFSVFSINFEHSLVDVTGFVFCSPNKNFPEDVILRESGGSIHPTEGDMWVQLEKVTLPTDTLLALFPDTPATDGSDQAEPAWSGSGAPGRPSSMHLVIQEYERRCEADEAERGTMAEAEVLSMWLRETYPDFPPAMPKTIANKIRGYQNARRKDA